MRSPHRDASADDRRGGWRPWRLSLTIVVLMASGCVTEREPRLMGGAEALKELGRPVPGPASASAAPTANSTASRGAAPAAASGIGGPTAPPSPPEVTPTSASAPASASASAPAPASRRVPIARASRVQIAGDSLPARSSDSEVRRTAERETVPVGEVTPPPSGQYPIDLATALRLADMVNPTINRARTVILEALAMQLTARTLLVPSLNAGATYHGHNGDLQRSSGKIINVSLQSLYLGAGASTAIAGTMGIPGVNILTPLTDAWFEPLVARQRVIASRLNARATENDILMEVAVYHLELIRHNVLLAATRLSESQAYEIVEQTRQFALIGQGRTADADRSRAEWRYRRADVINAEQGVGIAAARLAQRLNLDPSVRLQPVSGPLAPLHLVALDTPIEQLIQVALQQRPELAARTAEINQAQYALREEIGRPLLPTLWLGFSGGAFGGGSNLSPPLMGNFGGRTDFDVRLFWDVLNMGFGNAGLIKQRQAEANQAVALRARTLNRVRDEIATNVAAARAAHNQIEVARRELQSSRNGFHEDLWRTRNGLGRPIEVINSLDLLAAARMNLVNAIVEYDQAQFRLWVALGTPPPLVETSTPDQPAVPEYLVP